MDAKQLPIETTEVVALTEKKMDMSLDEIIKMSKKSSSRGRKPPRRPIKKQGFQNDNVSQGNTKVRRYMDSRSSVRQGVLAQRRSNFHGNQFPVATEVAKKAAQVPFHNRPANFNKRRVAITSVQRKAFSGSSSGKDKGVGKQRPQTLDALFASMKEQRMRTMSRQAAGGNGRQSTQRRNVQRQQWTTGGTSASAARQHGNFGR